MFPEALPSRLIKMFSFSSDTILDPFLGSGTTSLAAYNLNRNSVGYEINNEFIPKIKEKLNVHQVDIVGTDFIFLTDFVWVSNLHCKLLIKFIYSFKQNAQG